MVTIPRPPVHLYRKVGISTNLTQAEFEPFDDWCSRNDMTKSAGMRVVINAFVKTLDGWPFVPVLEDREDRRTPEKSQSRYLTTEQVSALIEEQVSAVIDERIKAALEVYSKRETWTDVNV